MGTMTMVTDPKFSVIIATYNWSSALKLALESVRAQTETNFEVLVVGDCCTDDSEAVVQAFGDSRFIWCNLPKNTGSQWRPNNHGLNLARGDYIAYLGHDDLWWPTHLEVAGRMFERSDVDMLAAMALMYGPPESGIRAVSGFFPNGSYTPRQFFPPSSMFHRRELAERVGGWRSPALARVAVDYDFLVRCHEAGARIAATNELTVFKFNAAWSRNAYRRRQPDVQREYLARMRQEGEAFRCRELSDALRAASENRLHEIVVPLGLDVLATQSAEDNQNFKGSRKMAKPAGTWEDGRLRIQADNGYAGFEWHLLEQHGRFGGFRWSGPSRHSTIVAPVPIDAPMEITLLVVYAVCEDVLHSARLSVNDVPVDVRLEPAEEGSFFLRADIAPECFPLDEREELRITILLEKTWRPIDLGANDDRRWLGLAIGWLELRKSTPVPSRGECIGDDLAVPGQNDS